eukprot:TRINITY_DN38396_c0_g1_i1.p1 TRINITY_DN38396_c0_g1~~TRINITY_DN38396_c0_g1_i1.p1  ORF type:complete len:587 (+),score=118.67 TRINITY_DN38396_c0_g1_i1:103-1761(+)
MLAPLSDASDVRPVFTRPGTPSGGSPKSACSSASTTAPRSSDDLESSQSLSSTLRKAVSEAKLFNAVDSEQKQRAQAQAAAPRPTLKLPVLGSRLVVRVSSLVEAELSVKLADGEQVGGGGQILAQNTSAVEFRSRSAISGSLCVAGAPAVEFGVQTEALKNGQLGNFVISAGRQRGWLTHAGELEAAEGTNVKGDGIVFECEMSPGPTAELQVKVRPAQKKELLALQQERALRRSMEKKKYLSLNAQITKAKHRSCDLRLIQEAEQLLRSLEMPEKSYLNTQQIQKTMKWKLITDDIDEIWEPCPTEDCPCNKGSAQEGEECSVTDGLVQEALDHIWPDKADKMLFKALVRAAEKAPDGCVWKSSGKFILSNKEQNQGCGAILSCLDQYDEDAGKAMRALVAYSEDKYAAKVSAVQVNIHMNEKSHHKQHRDIYGAGQKGGPNCTCTFVPAIGTICYSIGSSRHVLTETLTDERSKYEACSDDCKGARKFLVMRSGTGMFMNGKWNNNHSHGVPPCEKKCGPRISIACLLTKGAPHPGLPANAGDKAKKVK